MQGSHLCICDGNKILAVLVRLSFADLPKVRSQRTCGETLIVTG